MGYLLIHLLSLPYLHLLPRLLVHRVIIQTREDLSIGLGSDCNHIWLLTLGLRIIKRLRFIFLTITLKSQGGKTLRRAHSLRAGRGITALLALPRASLLEEAGTRGSLNECESSCVAYPIALVAIFFIIAPNWGVPFLKVIMLRNCFILSTDQFFFRILL